MFQDKIVQGEYDKHSKLRDGRVVEVLPGNTLTICRYSRGKRHGNYIGFSAKGRVRVGRWEHGKKQGQFIDTFECGTTKIMVYERN